MMDNEKPKTVLEKIVLQCTQAYQARTPLILLDTEEQELAEEAAKVVFSPRIRWEEMDVTPGDRAYYRALGVEEELEEPANLSRDCRELAKLFPGPSLLDNRMEPMVFVLHITRSSWRRDQTDAQGMMDALREYVGNYVRCRDNQSALRCSLVLLYGDVGLLAADLKPYTRIVEEDYPDRQELIQLVRQMAEENGTPLDRREDWVKLGQELAGFSLMDARRNIQALLLIPAPEGKPMIYDAERRVDYLREAKKQVLLQHGGLLTLCKEEPVAPQLGGMDRLLKWVRKYKDQILNALEYAQTRGTMPLKGILISGVPGCGKSEGAKILRQEWGLPMLQLNLDQLMGGYVGDSERNMRDALKQAEAMAPCILWIEELDKAFSGASRNSQDNAASKRMFGRFLMWMQENRRPCFIYATANDISMLPPEFFRSGRFDVLFSAFLPTYAECIAIFREQMRRADALHKEECRKSEAVAQDLFQGLYDASNPANCTGCYSDDFLGALFKLLTPSDGTPRFVSGADLAKITANALREMPPAAFQKPIDSLTWSEAVQKVLEDDSLCTCASGAGSMDQIVACMANLLRGSFVPAADSSQVLLRKEHYTQALQAAEAQSPWDTQSITADMCPYDKALVEAVAARLPRIASLIEQRASAALAGG